MDLVNVERRKVWASVGKMAQRSTVQVSAGKQVDLGNEGNVTRNELASMEAGLPWWDGREEQKVVERRTLEHKYTCKAKEGLAQLHRKDSKLTCNPRGDRNHSQSWDNQCFQGRAWKAWMNQLLARGSRASWSRGRQQLTEPFSRYVLFVFEWKWPPRGQTRKRSPGTATGKGIEGRMRYRGAVFHSQGLEEWAVECYFAYYCGCVVPCCYAQCW